MSRNKRRKTDSYRYMDLRSNGSVSIKVPMDSMVIFIRESQFEIDYKNAAVWSNTPSNSYRGFTRVFESIMKTRFQKSLKTGRLPVLTPNVLEAYAFSKNIVFSLKRQQGVTDLEVCFPFAYGTKYFRHIGDAWEKRYEA
jgi:hypothetical protein